MEKQTKILIGLAIGGVVGYLLFKPKDSSDISVPVEDLTTDVIDAQTNQVSTSTTTRTTTKASIVEKISNVLSTSKPISTSTTTQTTTMCEGQLVTMPNGTLQCVNALIITDQERLQNSFVPKEFSNELSKDQFTMSGLMTASDSYYIGGWAGGGVGGGSGMRGGPSDYIWSSAGTLNEA